MKRLILFILSFVLLSGASSAEITSLGNECTALWQQYRAENRFRSFAASKTSCSYAHSRPSQEKADSDALNGCGTDCEIFTNTVKEELELANQALELRRKKRSTAIPNDLTGKWLCKSYNSGQISNALLFNKNFAIRYFAPGFEEGVLGISTAREFDGDILFGGISLDIKEYSLEGYSECENPPATLYMSFAEGIALFERFDSISEACFSGSGALCADEVFKFIDVSEDDRISVAEIARFSRALALFAAYEGFLQQQGSDETFIELSKLSGTSLAMSLAAPVVTRSLLSSYDFDGDNFLTLDEIMQDREPLLSYSPELAGGSAIGASVMQSMVSSFMSGAIGNSTSMFGAMLGGAFQ